MDALFDAVAALLSNAATKTFLKKAAAIQRVTSTFGRLKAIGHNTEAKPLLDKAGVEPDAGPSSARRLCQPSPALLGTRGEGTHAGMNDTTTNSWPAPR